jgi:hypothetical protein
MQLNTSGPVKELLKKRKFVINWYNAEWFMQCRVYGEPNSSHTETAPSETPFLSYDRLGIVYVHNTIVQCKLSWIKTSFTGIGIIFILYNFFTFFSPGEGPLGGFLV